MLVAYMAGSAPALALPEGLERSRRSNWKHGHYSAEAKQVGEMHASSMP